jgi:hypothetical protein
VKPTLLVLAFSPIASDARVLKQIALFRDDWDVVTCGYGPSPDGVVEHIVIPDGLAVWRYSKIDVILRRYRRAYDTNEVIVHARQALSGRSFDAVLANDVDSVGLALELAPKLGVHADLHEYAPQQREDLLRVRLFVRPFLEWMCRQYVSRADSWTTVSHGIAAEYQRRFGFRPEVVVNAAPYSTLPTHPPQRPIRLVHSGACLRGRNLHLMIEAVQRAATDATLDMYLTPNDQDYLAEIRALAAKSERTRVLDPVPYSRLVETLNAYDIGVFLLPPSTFNHRWALPNKLFDYVQARLAIIVGPSPEMADFVDSHSLGVVTEDFSSQGLARVIESLTIEAVGGWKANADASALELSASNQTQAWRRAMGTLRGGH